MLRAHKATRALKAIRVLRATRAHKALVQLAFHHPSTLAQVQATVVLAMTLVHAQAISPALALGHLSTMQVC